MNLSCNDAQHLGVLPPQLVQAADAARVGRPAPPYPPRAGLVISPSGKYLAACFKHPEANAAAVLRWRVVPRLRSCPISDQTSAKPMGGDGPRDDVPNAVAVRWQNTMGSLGIRHCCDATPLGAAVSGDVGPRGGGQVLGAAFRRRETS